MRKIKDIGDGCVLNNDAKIAIETIIERIEVNDLSLKTTAVILGFIIEKAEFVN